MWESSFGVTKVIKPYAPSKPKPASWNYRLRRVYAEIKYREGNVIPLSQEIVRARLVLCDFRATWIGLFTDQPLEPGAEIAFTMDQPRRFFCFGKVTYSTLVPHASQIISNARYDYRTGIEIVFQSREQFHSIRKFAELLRTGAREAPRDEHLQPLWLAAG